MSTVKKIRRALSIHRFCAARAGMAATEFALLLPVMLALFFGVVESSDALSTSRKVSVAVNTLADLASQENEILVSSVDDLFTGVEQIVDVGSAPMTVRLVSVVTNDNGDPVVHWSRDNNGGTPYAADAAYDKLPDPALLNANASIVVAEVSYSYSSNLMGHFIPSVTFDKQATRWPRRSMRVQLCTSPGVCS